MWLSKRTVLRETESGADAGTVTIGGGEPGVMTALEERDMAVYTAGGYIWRPKAGDSVLVVKCEGGSAVAGKAMEKAAAEMEGGEVYIKSDKASVHLKNDGRIEISGRVNIVGSLTVNGNAVG